MKKQWMKSIGLAFLLAGMAVPTFAQHPEGQQQERRQERREIPSPENNARNITREFKKIFQLTDEGYDKVYELYLKQEKSLMPEQGNGNRGGMPSRGGMGRPGGGGPGGAPGGGPGMGGPGGGTPPQGGFQPGGNREMPEDLKAQMEEMRKEQEKKQAKAYKTLKKKMKKILKGDQYTQWEQWEANRKNREPEQHR